MNGITLQNKQPYDQRQPEIEIAQALQLEEWRRISFFTQNPLIYLQFKTLAALLGRFSFTQQAWLRQQKGLREGVLPVTLKV